MLAQFFIVFPGDFGAKEKVLEVCMRPSVPLGIEMLPRDCSFGVETYDYRQDFRFYLKTKYKAVDETSRQGFLKELRGNVHTHKKKIQRI